MTAANERAAANRRMKDRKRRAKLAARLRSEGVNQQLIEKIIDQERHDDLVAKLGEDRARAVRRAQAPNDPDDRGYEPSTGDPLLRGVARPTGLAAKVVRRGHTITKFEHDRVIEREKTP